MNAKNEKLILFSVFYIKYYSCIQFFNLILNNNEKKSQIDWRIFPKQPKHEIPWTLNWAAAGRDTKGSKQTQKTCLQAAGVKGDVAVFLIIVIVIIVIIG